MATVLRRFVDAVQNIIANQPCHHHLVKTLFSPHWLHLHHAALGKVFSIFNGSSHLLSLSQSTEDSWKQLLPDSKIAYFPLLINGYLLSHVQMQWHSFFAYSWIKYCRTCAQTPVSTKYIAIVHQDHIQKLPGFDAIFKVQSVWGFFSEQHSIHLSPRLLHGLQPSPLSGLSSESSSLSLPSQLQLLCPGGTLNAVHSFTRPCSWVCSWHLPLQSSGKEQGAAFPPVRPSGCALRCTAKIGPLAQLVYAKYDAHLRVRFTCIWPISL